jgi:hypothetical protein
MSKLNPLYLLLIALSVVAMFALSAPTGAEAVKPVAKSLKPEETAILLVDFQANFVSPDGAWSPNSPNTMRRPECSTARSSWSARRGRKAF